MNFCPSFLLVTLTVGLLNFYGTVKGDEDDTDEESHSHYETGCEDKCGRPLVRPNVGNRIVGGTVARKYSWCWQASLQRHGNNGFFHTCGGSCINSRWIITAAHCVFRLGERENFEIVLGEWDRAEPYSSSHRVVYSVEKIVIHSDYEGEGNHWKDDIALVKVTEPIRFSKYICPVCLPPNDYDVKFSNCWATGWGRKETYGPPSMTLNQVIMTHYSLAECSRPDWYGDMLGDKMISFGHDVGGRGTCQGDSGGPLVCTGSDGIQWTLYGLTSWAKGSCASAKHPTIFTDVAKYNSWIHETMEMNNEEEYTWC